MFKALIYIWLIEIIILIYAYTKQVIKENNN